MPNERGQDVPFAPFSPDPSAGGAIPSAVTGAATASGDALSGVSSQLEARVSAWGDQLAANEGRRAGDVAGTDPNFRPTDGPTIRDQAFDQAAAHTYLSNLTAQFHSDALTLAEQNRANPQGFQAGMTSLVNDYKQNHVFPEIMGGFTDAATNIDTMLRRHLFNQWQEQANGQMQASMLSDIQTNSTNQDRILALAPNDPQAETQINTLRDQNIANIQQQVANGSLHAVQGQKLIEQEMQSAASKLYMARAETLTNPADVDAYRGQIRQQFADGKLPGVIDYPALDASLAKVGQQKSVQLNAGVKSLSGDLDTFLSQQKNGLVGNTAEWAEMQARGNALGPQGQALVATAQQKLQLQAKLAALSPDQADTYLQNLTQAAKSPQPITTPGAFATGYSPQAGGDAVEGDYRSAVPGPDGQKIVRTLEDVRTGASSYVTLAGDPSLYGQSYTIPSVTYQANGQTYTLKNVQGVVHDTGPAFQGQPAGRFDIAIARDLNASERNQSMSATKFVPNAQGQGIWSGTADLLNYGKSYNDARRKLIGTDPLAAALNDNTISSIAPVDFNAAPTDLGAQMQTRVAQAQAVASQYQRPAQYIRPDEKPVLQARLDQGGDVALQTVQGIVAGAGTAAPQVLKEIGGTAPELAHAAWVQQQTGDPTFARGVADAIAAKAVPGAKLPEPSSLTVDTAVKSVLGTALNGLSGDELARTRAAVTAYASGQMARKGLQPSDPAVAGIVTDALQKARGQTGSGNDTFGGIAPVSYTVPGLFSTSATAQVQVPADVRASQLGDVLGAVTDQDLKALPDPPVTRSGAVSGASDLRRYQPVYVPGGYRFVSSDPTTGMQTPVMAKSGQPFVLPLTQLKPALRQRVPGAFR